MIKPTGDAREPSPTRTRSSDQAPEKAGDAFRRLVAIMARLRAPNGCPWDREQTHKSLTPYLIEEAYEVKEALDQDDFDALREELGDLALQVVFHAQLAKEAGRFDVDDALGAICDKLIRRHPHVFGDVVVNGSAEVLRNWEDIKKEEKAPSDGHEAPPSVLSGVPPSLPALLKAHRIQQKVAGVGFDWPDLAPIWEKIHEEIDELREAVEQGPSVEIAGRSAEIAEGSAEIAGRSEHVADEFGDLLFSLVNMARRLGIAAEEALDGSNRKFMKRFRAIEIKLHALGKRPSDMTLDELDVFWEEAKKE